MNGNKDWIRFLQEWLQECRRNLHSCLTACLQHLRQQMQDPVTRKRVLHWLRSTGLWVQPVCFLVLLIPSLCLFGFSYFGTVTQISFLVSVVITVLTILSNPDARKDHRREKNRFSHPPVDTALLQEIPQGFVYGRQGESYVCSTVNETTHVLVIGGSGSGKSSCLVIPTLLSVLHPFSVSDAADRIRQDSGSFLPGEGKADLVPERPAAIFAIDIKGELSFKTVPLDMDGSKIHLVNFDDRSTDGFDPFYRLTGSPTNQEILEQMRTIVYSLIPVSAEVKDPFWQNSARSMLLSALIYYYKSGKKNLIDLVDVILGQPIRETIREIIENSLANSNEYRYMIQFFDMADETLSGIYSELANAVSVFSDENLRYAFRDNPFRVTPAMLEQRESIYLVIREEKLTDYTRVLQMILNLMLGHLETRKEDADPILCVIDELPRILSAGKIQKLMDSARTLRSRNVKLMLITQSLEALMTAYSENETIDLVSNCAWKVILDASSSKTAKTVCEWAGSYLSARQSFSGEGLGRKATVSYDSKEILEPADLMTLIRSGELILIGPYGYNRISKCPYYLDPVLGPLSDSIQAKNKIIQEVKEHIDL